ncbi:MAG: RHS repeat-associated core domain-containing protein [Bacteroidales bacterium]
MDIYGKVRSFEGDKTFLAFLFQGQTWDEDVQLAYNRFRWYSPDTGTYISQDPIGLASGEFNLYSYVGDSNTWIDPFGLEKKYNKAENNKDVKKISDSLLKEKGLDAHEIKKEFLGQKAKISRYDLHKHTDTKEILIFEKGGVGEPISTGYTID